MKNYCPKCDEFCKRFHYLGEELLDNEHRACPKCGEELISIAVPDTPTPEEEAWFDEVVRKRHPGCEPVKRDGDDKSVRKRKDQP